MARNIRISGVSPNEVYTKHYATFRGVDFSKDASMVDDEHSPDARNIISDSEALPEKRLGWRTVMKFTAPINGIFQFGAEDEKCTIVHTGTEIYKLKGDERELLIEGIADRRSTGKYFKGKLCILTGEEFLVFDGERCVRADEYEDMYVPITLVSRGAMYVGSADTVKDETFLAWKESGVLQNKDGSGVNVGTMPEDVGVNLISPKRKNHFEYPKDSFSAFVLDATIDKKSRVIMRYIPTGEVIFDVVFDPDADKDYYYHPNEGEVINGDILGDIPTETAPYPHWRIVIGNSLKNGCGFVICRPMKTKIDGYFYIPGVDDFSIEYSHTVEGYAEKINRCTVLDVFENRVFFSGNPDFPNADWYSGVNDPLYIPDINYTEIGLDSSGIMGYLRTGDSQAILKSDGDGATIYMRSYQMQADGKVIFPLRQGISGLGAISKRAICTFLDDPLYLTRNGVYAISVQDISSERALNIRSTKINKKLLGEGKLTEAVMCEWNGYMLLAVGSNVYVADSAQKQYPQNKTNTFEYEWYFWTDIPARVMLSYDGELFFGTEDGRLCKFNTDIKNSRGEIAAEAYSDDGAAIVAQWATNLSDDGSFMTEKTLVKTGSGVFLKTYNRSGISVSVRTERDFGRKIAERSAGIFNFEDFDFAEFTFNTAPYTVVPLNVRIKKYSAIQIICRNDKPNHAFGIGGITRKYFYGKTKK